MSITYEIYNKVIQYLNGDIKLSDLENWIVPNLERVVNLPPSPERDLAGEIELGLSEMTAGHRTENEFKTELRELLQSSIIEFETRQTVISRGLVDTELTTIDASIPADSSTIEYDIIRV